MTFAVLADECVPRAVVSSLRDLGFDVRYAADTDGQAPDADLLVLAEVENRIILTEDFDFGDLLVRMKMRAPGAIILFMPDATPDERAARVASVVKDAQFSPRKKLTVISRMRVRQRELANERDEAMTGRMTRVKSRDGFEFDAYHVAPAGSRKGGVIVVQEIFGLSDHIKAMADMFGAAGYEVIAPSMYDRARPGFIVQPADVGAHMEEGSKLAVGNGPENAMNDVGGCFDVLAKSGPVFVTGFCYGGSMSWLAASRIDGLKAASCYYGGNIPDMADLKLNCPVICHFGKKDPFIPAEKVDAITAKHPDVPVYWYDADHGFARKGSYSYDEPSAKLAHERTLELFAKSV